MAPAVRTLVVLAAAAAVLGTVASWFARVEGHWSVDSAVWELMTREVARRGWHGLWVENLARNVDPEGRFFPGFFFVRVDDRYHFSFQPAFALLSAPLYQAFGRLGLVVVPLVAALVVGWLVAQQTEKILPGSGWAGAAALLFLTPVLLYAVTVWNHLPSVALLTLAAFLTWRSGFHAGQRLALLAGGLAAGLALLFRNEAYLYGAATVTAWILAARPQDRWRGALLLLAGFAAGWAVQAAVNWQLFGSLFGPKAESVAARQAAGALDLTYRLWNLYLFTAAPDFSAFLRGGVGEGLLLFAAVVLAAALLGLQDPDRRPWLAAAGLWAVAVADAVVLARRTQVTGFFWVAPFTVVAFVRRPLTPPRVFLWTLVLCFGAGVVWTASHGGFQWGPRYLLALYPLGVWLTADAWAALAPTTRRVFRWPATCLVVLSLLAQAAGVDHADQGQWRATQALRTIRDLRTEYVLVGLEIFAWDFAPAYGEKILMTVDSQAELEQAVRQLAASRIQRFTYIPRSGLAFDPRVVERVRWGGSQYRVARDVSSGGLRAVEYHLTGPGRR
ncbi:MAG: hypothetical protein RMM30_04025 [Armatimonadota bacterium]|nr:hypothetical protein [Armatimonadota bacterium]MDW8155735.1 hypothetical protein [Armatimonadota bacterium]